MAYYRVNADGGTGSSMNATFDFKYDGTCTLAEFIDEVEKNGYKQAIGKLMEFDENFKYNILELKKEDITAACAWGQGMLNLNARSIFALDQESARSFDRVLHAVAKKNDKERKAPDVIAREIREEYPEELKAKFGYVLFGSATETPGFWSSR